MRWSSLAGLSALVLGSACSDPPAVKVNPADAGDAATPSDGGSGPVDAGSCVHTAPKPVVEDSVQKVTIRVRNQGTADRWLVTTLGCGAIGVKSDRGTSTLSAPFQCGCQCGDKPKDSVSLARIPAGAERSITWDATELVAREICLECGTSGKTAQFSVLDRKVAPAGTYAVSVRTLASPPCTASSADEAKCDGTCAPEGETKSGTLTLPASGGAEVVVDL